MLLLVACAASAALSLVAMGATLIYRASVGDEIRRQTHEQCQALEAVKSAIRLVFKDNLVALEQRRKTMDPSQYRIAHDYYVRQLERFKREQCP